ncbi:MAG: hypothetical protein GY737_32475 [Desulfobacteraceae bacterium]|nr:hypothetical protein [Desulfobacteraceae bacterium]
MNKRIGEMVSRVLPFFFASALACSRVFFPMWKAVTFWILYTKNHTGTLKSAYFTVLFQ